MATTRLFPNATTGAGMTTNAATHHAGLSDASDATWSSSQLSSTVTVVTTAGPSLTLLPTQSGSVKGVVINCRASLDPAYNDGDLTLLAGENSNNRFSGVPLTTVITTYSTAQLNLGPVSAINALGWIIGFQFVQNNGVLGKIFELNFDVEWYATSGFQAMMFEVLGPLTAVGLWELPKIAAWFRSVHRTRFGRAELERLFREQREDRRPHSIVMP